MADPTLEELERLSAEENLGADGALEQIASLIARALDLGKQLAEAESEVSAISAAIRQIEFDRLPEAMRAARVGAFTTEDGTTVAISQYVSATLGRGKTESVESHDARVEKALAWLEATGNAGIIKLALSAQLDRGDRDTAERASAALSDAGVAHELVEDIHPATLKKFVEEQIANAPSGVLPKDVVDLFRVSQAERAVVKAPKSATPKRR